MLVLKCIAANMQQCNSVGEATTGEVQQCYINHTVGLLFLRGEAELMYIIKHNKHRGSNNTSLLGMCEGERLEFLSR